MRAKDYIRCEIEPLENTSWTFQQIREISQINGFHKECYIYKFDYNKISNMTFQEAKKLIDKEYANRTETLCTKFITTQNQTKYATKQEKEFSTFCKELKCEIFYDFISTFFLILGNGIVLPFADLFGRRKIINFGLHFAFICAFIKIISLGSSKSLIVTMFLNIAYPALKYTTQTIIFEISTDSMRPLAFKLTHLGSSVCFLIYGSLPAINWPLMKILTFFTFVFLPLLSWSIPESPLWLTSKNRKEARVIMKNLNKTYEHDDFLIELRNRKFEWITVKKHLQECKKISWMEYTSLVIVSLSVGFLHFYPASNYIFGSKLGLILILCINILFYAALSSLYKGLPYETSIIILVSMLEVFGGCANILYQFYLSEIFPTSHRCSYIGFFHMFVALGLFITNCIRLKNVFIAEVVTYTAALIAVVILIMFLRPTRPKQPLFLNFDDENIQSSR